MKKSVIAALALSLFLMAGAASASIIGIFGDTGATTCVKAMSAQYTYAEVYFCALLDDTAAISACEFGATGVVLPGTIITVTWDTTLVIGNIQTADGVALAFPVPKAAPLAYLGKIQYFILAPQMPNTVLSVVPSGAGNLVIVDAGTASELPAEGWRLIVNCVPGGDYGNCLCENTIATEDAAWGQIKALY
ncbi:MAG: hypothetical protein FJ189_07510 [Gammaproteobacteria bacterium]|nr:hypothetical protein [Gammaproteobacteria bacterium]